ncbi:hypothetical protein QTJ16_005669 [Diplocarpon rosae]|uniref:Uncharacterized protein n=1 Tax=Diplocarpon rosae TaxID=946125 RepID=A0AAD9SX54_9HELO|nr:hypothetical protein QTJ16_005669 [Diplocarpon rosae]
MRCQEFLCLSDSSAEHMEVCVTAKYLSSPRFQVEYLERLWRPLGRSVMRHQYVDDIKGWKVVTVATTEITQGISIGAAWDTAGRDEVQRIAI